MGIISLLYFIVSLLISFKNQVVAPLMATRIYRLAITISVHSEVNAEYENSARSVIVYHENGINIS
jgi:hypothetical protein